MNAEASAAVAHRVDVAARLEACFFSCCIKGSRWRVLDAKRAEFVDLAQGCVKATTGAAAESI
jgi:hypothetical protein